MTLDSGTTEHTQVEFRVLSKDVRHMLRDLTDEQIDEVITSVTCRKDKTPVVETSRVAWPAASLLLDKLPVHLGTTREKAEAILQELELFKQTMH